MQREKAYVRYKPGEENLTISLVLGGKQRNLNRPIDEPLEKPFSRIKANLASGKADKRKKKKKKVDAADQSQQQQQQEAEVFVGLFRDTAATQLFDPSTPNGQAWPSAALLRVGDADFELCINPPTVDTLSLQAFPMVGYPLLPTISYSFADPSSSRWRWLRRSQQQQQQQQQQGRKPQQQQQSEAEAGWEDTGCSSMRYTPTHADLGCVLRVECTPVAKQQHQEHKTTSTAAAAAAAEASGAVLGEAVSAETGPVLSGPQRSAARLRALSPGVALPEPWRFRVMSYNILADQYAGTSYAQQVLFKYCPTQLLDNNYRRQLVLEEVMRYQPDVCCLQEVDDKVFAEYLSPHLALAGFGGHYTNKQGKVREGSAMFWREDKWGLAAVRDVMLRDVFKQPLSPRHAQFASMLESSPDLDHALQKVATIAQMVLLVPRTAATAAGSNGSNGAAAGGSNEDSTGAFVGAPGPLLMINTHLFFHPYAPHIRTLHTAAVLEEAAAALADLQQQQQQQGSGSNPDSNPGSYPADSAALAGFSRLDPHLLSQLGSLPPPTVLFCGDLNSDLNDGVPGVIELLQTGRLAADHWDWKMGASFKWGKEEGEYAEEGQQQQQQQEQQVVVADGHDFDPPAESPTKAVALYGKDVSVPFVLRSADDLETPYTNYTSGYKALLDYVWYDPQQLTVTAQLPQPSEQLLASFIPSPNFPSDHLAVVYDLAFKPQPSAAAAAGGSATAAGSSGSSEPVRHVTGDFTLLPASEDHVGDAVAALQAGQVIALPTDTLYGLAAAAGNAAAVQQLRRIKQRDSSAPFAVAVADVADVSLYCSTQQLPPGLLAALLPGPVTVLLPRRSDADAAALAEGVFGPGAMDAAAGPAVAAAAAAAAAGAAAAAPAAVVGVRVVPQEFVRRVCRGLGGGIALTSANLSGAESSLCIADFRDLWQYCGCVFDGGCVPVPSNEGSTIVDLTAVNTQQQQQQQQAGSAAQGTAASQRGFCIVRAGVAAGSVVELLTKSFGLQQML